MVHTRFSEISLIVASSSNDILPQNHFTIINFFLASFMIQLTSIVINRRKLRSKILKYSVHAIIPRKPAHIRSKITTKLYYLCLYGCEYSVDYKSTAYFCPNILYLYRHNDGISVYHPHFKNYQKRPPHVTLPRRTTLHKKIHLYALVHKTPPRKPAI